jgi:inosine-uridine nucleoside N-ribohydrolase
VALLVLAAAEERGEIVIDSVFAVGGNVDSAQTAKNAIQVLSATAVPAPVFRGATPPSSRRNLIGGAERFHGRDGLGGMAHPDIDVPRRPRNIGSALVSRVVAQAERPTNLLCLGPLTDIARALTFDPTFAGLINRAVVMGGTLGHPLGHPGGPAGNITPWAEYNFYADPASAAQVVSSELPIELVPLDASQSVVFRETDVRDLNPFAASIIRRSIDFHRKTLDLDGAYLHDAVAAAVLLRPDLSRTVEAKLQVRKHGRVAGSLRVEPSQVVSTNGSSVVVEINVESMKSFILASLSSIEPPRFGYPEHREGSSSRRLSSIQFS